jgi:hypothetical protein
MARQFPHSEKKAETKVAAPAKKDDEDDLGW